MADLLAQSARYKISNCFVFICPTSPFAENKKSIDLWMDVCKHFENIEGAKMYYPPVIKGRYPIDVNHNDDHDAPCLIIDPTCPAFPFLNKHLKDLAEGRIDTPEFQLYKECRDKYHDAIGNMPPQTAWEYDMLEACASVAYSERSVERWLDKRLAKATSPINRVKAKAPKPLKIRTR